MPAVRAFLPTRPHHVGTARQRAESSPPRLEAAILELKTQLHLEIMRSIKKRKLTPRQLEKLLDVPQPRVSELTSGKISRMTADLLTKYLYRLGRKVTVKTRPGNRATATA